MEKEEFQRVAIAAIDGLFGFASALTNDPSVADEIVGASYATFVIEEPFEFSSAADVRLRLLQIVCEQYQVRRGDVLSRPTPLEQAIASGGGQASTANEGCSPGLGSQTPACYDLSALDWEQAGARLSQVIGALPLPYRAVFLLWGEGLKYQQIADVLNLSQETVKRRLYRSRMMVSTGLGQFASDWTIPIRPATPPADAVDSGEV